MKRIFLTILTLFIMIFTQNAFAEDVFKINAANFDTSNSLVVLNIPDDSQTPVMDNIKLVKLENPNRVYFDIPSAILTIPKQDWNFPNQGINEIKISQFTTNPNAVRVVMYYKDNFNPNNLKFLRLKNNLIIKLKDTNVNDQYFHNTYRDEHASSSDFYESLTVEIPDSSLPKENITEQIQQAFNTNPTTVKMDTPTLVKKDLRLSTKYYLNKVTPKNNAILLNGFGSITMERPLILQNPSRVVFDIPNTVVSNSLRNKEFQLNETDAVKIGQFQVNKARIVIMTPDFDKYIPIYSTDNQSVLLANYAKTNHTSLFTHASDIVTYKLEKNDAQTSSMILQFNHPIVHAIDRTNSMLRVYLLNVAQYNEEEFKNTFKNTKFNNISLLPNVGMRLNIPIQPDSLVNTYLGADSKTFKIKITDPKASTPPIFKRSSGQRVIVIDPGHGGNDYGALRDNVNEKDITLDVSERVKDILTKQGYKVSMTRETDATVSLEDRVNFSENIQPDMFVSIHVNASEKPEITGVETHYYKQNSLSLAQTVHASLAGSLNTNNRGLFKSKFYVINHTTAPAILVEIGFISNAEERAELISEKRKQATAKAIAEGVQNYFKNNK